jgi:hypothetical protein
MGLASIPSFFLLLLMKRRIIKLSMEGELIEIMGVKERVLHFPCFIEMAFWAYILFCPS